MNPKLTGLIAAILFVLTFMWVLLHGWYYVTIGVAAFAILVRFSGRVDLLWMAVLVTSLSNIVFGLANRSYTISGMIMGVFGLLSMLTQPLVKRRVARAVVWHAVVALFWIVIVTASVRGWGLSVLGSKTWGGMQYVNLLIALAFYIYSVYIILPEKKLWKTVCGMWGLSLLPAVAFFIAYFVPSISGLVGWLVQIGGEFMVSWDASGETVTRWQILSGPATGAGMLAVLFYDRRQKITLGAGGMALVSVVLMGLSGHRAVSVLLGMTLMIYAIVRWRKITWVQRLAGVVLMALAIGALYGFAHHLPLSFQRSVAWLPGIPISLEAKVSALNTSEWRIELWRQTFNMIPEYVWIGRGLGFDLTGAYNAFTLASDRGTEYQFFIAVHNYHNGPLWLLIDLGLAGLLAGLVFMVGSVVRYGRCLGTIPEHTQWKQVYVITYSYFVAACIFFFTVFGGGVFFAQIVLAASILEVIVRSVAAEKNKADAQPAPKPIRTTQVHPISL